MYIYNQIYGGLRSEREYKALRPMIRYKIISVGYVGLGQHTCKFDYKVNYYQFIVSLLEVTIITSCLSSY